MAVWLARGVTTKLVAASLGLIMGGAASNAIDRLSLGGVADFFSLHAFGFYWYVFNIADVAIVAGVIGLLYDSLGSESQRCLKGHLTTDNEGLFAGARDEARWRTGQCMAQLRMSFARWLAGGRGRVRPAAVAAAPTASTSTARCSTMMGISPSAQEARKFEPQVAERAPLVMPPNSNQAPAAGLRAGAGARDGVAGRPRAAQGCARPRSASGCIWPTAAATCSGRKRR